jgi:radical SAM protein with 4Fe4S-binding SPASM domain
MTGLKSRLRPLGCTPNLRVFHRIPLILGYLHRSDPREFQAYEYIHGKRLERSDYICQEPFWFPTVFADGTLVACEQDLNAQHTLGRIAPGTTFRELWWSDRAASIRRSIRDNPRGISFCRNCPYRDREVTDCSIEAHFLNDAIDFSNVGMQEAG